MKRNGKWTKNCGLRSIKFIYYVKNTKKLEKIVQQYVSTIKFSSQTSTEKFLKLKSTKCIQCLKL